MGLLAFGLNYQTAPLAMREKVSIGQGSLQETLVLFQRALQSSELFILSTCNRTEIYCLFEEGPLGFKQMLEVLANFCTISQSELKPYLYFYSDLEAIKHLMRVASGLQSMVLGEAEILGQVKKAFLTAKASGTLRGPLGRLLETTLFVAKRVRTETGLGLNPLSFAHLAAKLSQKIFSRLDSKTVLLIGRGQLIRKTAEHLNKINVLRFLIANRTLDYNNPDKTPYFWHLTSNTVFEMLSLQALRDRIHEADMIISGIETPLPIIGKGMIECALKDRKGRPMLIIDLGVPRTIEPEVSSLEDIFLYNLDDLKSMAEDNRRAREEFIPKAENIIAFEAYKWVEWIKSTKWGQYFIGQEISKDLSKDLSKEISKEISEEMYPEITNKLNSERDERINL